MGSVVISLCHPFLPSICCLLPHLPFCLSPSISPCFPVAFEMRTDTVGCGDAPVSSIENVLAALMMAGQNYDCLSTFFMVRCQMDVSCLMKIICTQFPVPLCSCYQLCVCVCVCVCVCMWVCVLELPSHLHWYLCIEAQKYSHIFIHICACVFWTWLCGFALMSVNAHMYVFLHLCVCVCVCVFMFLQNHFHGWNLWTSETPLISKCAAGSSPPLPSNEQWTLDKWLYDL